MGWVGLSLAITQFIDPFLINLRIPFILLAALAAQLSWIYIWVRTGKEISAEIRTDHSPPHLPENNLKIIRIWPYHNQSTLNIKKNPKKFQNMMNTLGRPANNSHLSGILVEFTKIFCEIQLFRLKFSIDLKYNIACFSSILIDWQ